VDAPEGGRCWPFCTKMQTTLLTSGRVMVVVACGLFEIVTQGCVQKQRERELSET